MVEVKYMPPNYNIKNYVEDITKHFFLEVMLDNQIVVVLPFSKRQKNFFVLKLG